MERFRGEDTPDAGRQLTRLSSLPEPYVVKGWSLVSDGPAMSRMARTPQEDSPGHRETMPLLFEVSLDVSFHYDHNIKCYQYHHQPYQSTTEQGLSQRFPLSLSVCFSLSPLSL